MANINVEFSGFVETQFPLRVISEPNARGHWQKRHKRSSNQHNVVGWELAKIRPMVATFTKRPPVLVTLTLQTAQELDGDNLQAGLKAVRDEVAKFLGLDDADPRVRWAYGQEPAEARGVRIRFERVNDEAPATGRKARKG
jgi:hypothetical protein